MREAPAAQHEPAAQPIDGREIRERAAPRRLAEHLDAERLPPEDRLQLAACDAVELRERQIGLPRHAAPDRVDRAFGRIEASQRTLETSVLDGDGADGRHGQDRGSRRDSQPDEQRPLRVRSKPPRRVAERDECARARPLHRRHRVTAAEATANGLGPAG
jgi:hypothetical protein